MGFVQVGLMLPWSSAQRVPISSYPPFEGEQLLLLLLFTLLIRYYLTNSLELF